MSQQTRPFDSRDHCRESSPSQGLQSLRRSCVGNWARAPFARFRMRRGEGETHSRRGATPGLGWVFDVVKDETTDHTLPPGVSRRGTREQSGPCKETGARGRVRVEEAGVSRRRTCLERRQCRPVSLSSPRGSLPVSGVVAQPRPPELTAKLRGELGESSSRCLAEARGRRGRAERNEARRPGLWWEDEVVGKGHQLTPSPASQGEIRGPPGGSRVARKGRPAGTVSGAGVQSGVRTKVRLGSGAAVTDDEGPASEDEGVPIATRGVVS